MTENQERAEQARSAFTVLTDLYNEILADYSSPLKLVKSRAFISALLPHLTFVNGANVPSIRYGIRKYVLGEG